MASSEYCCKPSKDALRIATTLHEVKSQVDAFQSLNIKKSHMDYEILLNRLEEILKPELTKLQDSKKKNNDDDDEDELSLQCLCRCPAMKLEVCEQIQHIQNKIDQFKNRRKSKSKSGDPTILTEIKDIIQKKDTVKKSALSPNPDENMKPEDQSPTQNDQESIAVGKEESSDKLPIGRRRSKRSSSVFNIENNKAPAKRPKTSNGVKNMPTIEKEETKTSFKQKSEDEPSSTDSSQNSSVDSKRPKRDVKIRDVSVLLEKLDSEEVERVMKKRKNKSNPNKNSNNNNGDSNSRNKDKSTTSKLSGKTMKDSKGKEFTPVTKIKISTTNNNNNNSSSSPPKQKDDNKKSTPTSLPPKNTKSSASTNKKEEDDDDCVLLFANTNQPATKNTSPKLNSPNNNNNSSMYEISKKIIKNNNNKNNDDDDCVIECEKNTSSPKKSTTTTTTTTTSTPTVLKRTPIRYKYDELFFTPMDEHSLINDYLALDRSTLFQFNFSKYYIRFYDDRMLSMDGRILMLHQHQSESENKPPEKTIYQHKLKVMKCKIMKEQEYQRQLQTTSLSSSSTSTFVENSSTSSSPSFNTSKRITVGLDVRDVNLFLREPQDFIEFFKDIITHLSFGRRLYSNRLITENTLFHLLTRQLNKLEYLLIDDEMVMPWNERLFYSPILQYPCLTRLKILHLSQTKRNIFTWKFISNLLKQAPNLSKIYGLPLNYIGAVEQTGHEGRILKSVSGIYRLSCEDLIQHSQKLLFHLPHLTGMKSQGLEVLDLRGFSSIGESISLKDDEDNCKTVQHYTELVKYNRISLKRLKLRPMTNLSFIQSFEFPRMPHLDTLQLYFEKKDVKIRFFPKNWVLTSICPRLKNVEIKFSKEFKKSKEDSSSSTTTATTTTSTTNATTTTATIYSEVFPLSANLKAMAQPIDHLKLVGLDSGLEQLSPLFLNISKLTIAANCSMLNANLRHGVFSGWPRLKCLQIELEMSDVCCLDAVIVGMDEHVLHNFNSPDKIKLLNSNNIDTYRKYPSLSDLKDLSVFKIIFMTGLKHTHHSKADIGRKVLFSRASGLFGFGKKIMPKLEVIIKFDSKLSTADRRDIFGLLEPVRPYTVIDV